MKYITKLVIAIFVIATLLNVFASCAQTGVSNETTGAQASTNLPEQNINTEAEETVFVPDDLDEKYNLNETITFFIWSDHAMREYFADDSGELIDNAIYNRNIRVSERLGIEIEFIQEKGGLDYFKNWNLKASNDWLSDCQYDVYSGYSRGIPLLAIEGMTSNLIEYDTFNVEKPWWPDALITECTVNDKLLFCSGDISTSLLWYMDAVFYNKDLYDDYYLGQPSPMDMVEQNEWTIEKLFALCKGRGIEGTDLDAFYGFSIYETDIDAFQIGSGIISLEKTEDGGLRISEDFKSQRCADICEMVGTFLASADAFHADAEEARDVFFNERSIFHLDRVLIVAGEDNTQSGKIEFNYGLVPVPKYEVDQENYGTNLGFSYSLYAINNNSKIVEEAVLTLEAMASESYRSVSPIVFEVAMKHRYSPDAQSSAMFDILRDSVSFDIGRLLSAHFSNYTSKTFRASVLTNPNGYLTLLAARTKSIELNIQKLMKSLDE